MCFWALAPVGRKLSFEIFVKLRGEPTYFFIHVLFVAYLNIDTHLYITSAKEGLCFFACVCFVCQDLLATLLKKL